MRKAVLCFLALALLSALPMLAAPVNSVESGIDVWWTAADGTTFIDFAKQPIPKGFFCPRSEAFTGKVVLRGRPLATGSPGELGGADTIVQRLDNATFDKGGIAETRIQFRALRLESVAPIKTGCGTFNLQVALAGQQPVTKMRIVRENEVGGHYTAPLRVKFRMTFTPTEGISARRLQLVQGFQLLPARNATWGAIRSTRPASLGAETLIVDTDGDQIPDTSLPKSSGNFLPGLTLERALEMHARTHPPSKSSEGEDTVPGSSAEPPTESPACDRTNQVYYERYGTYGCHTDGADPTCHPETIENGMHCSRACIPCASDSEVPDSDTGH